MIHKNSVLFTFVCVFCFLISVFFIQFSIREKKDTLYNLQKKIEKKHDEKQSLKVRFSELTNQTNLQKLEKELFNNRVGLAGQK